MNRDKDHNEKSNLKISLIDCTRGLIGGAIGYAANELSTSGFKARRNLYLKNLIHIFNFANILIDSNKSLEVSLFSKRLLFYPIGYCVAGVVLN